MQYQTIFNIGDKAFFITKNNIIVNMTVDFISVHHLPNGDTKVWYMDLHKGYVGDCHDVFRYRCMAEKEIRERKRNLDMISFV